MSRWHGLLGLVSLLALVRTAQASSLAFSVENCTGVDEAQTRRILDIELRAYLTHQAASLTRVSVSCSDANAHILVNDESTHKSTARVIDLSGVPELARSRALALAAAELIAWSWTELVFLDRPQQPAPTTLPAAAPFAPTVERGVERPLAGSPLPVRWALMADARLPLGEGQPLWGGGGALSAALGQYLYLGGDVQAHAGSLPLPQGRAQLLAADFRSAVGVEHRAQWLALQADLGGRAGLLRYSARAADTDRYEGRELSGLWAGPSVTAGLRFRTSSLISIALSSELGYALWSPRGTMPGRATLDLAGPWVAFRLGLGAT